MKKHRLLLTILLFSLSILSYSQDDRYVISLNGTVDFEQTKTSLPPKKFTHKIQVPGLIDLATPKLEQYEDYFTGKQEPRYNWYRFKFNVPEKYNKKYAVLNILKSRYNTQIILNGHDCGTYMQCNTPIVCNLTGFINYNKENTLLIRIGERAWLPKESATGFDREKFADIPGIWDDVSISFSGPLRIEKSLILPNLKESKITAKVILENYGKILERNMEYSYIEYTLSAYVREKKTGKKVSETYIKKDKIKCQQYQNIEFELDVNNPHPWSCNDPFLYETVLNVSADAKHFQNYGNPENLRPTDNYSWIGFSDQIEETFGMRDFKAVERTLELNGERIFLRGSTITLNRFFEDDERDELPWNKKWVEDLFINIPKSMGWNGFRVCIGLLPEFWYDLADEHGILLQNEYLMWNLRGRNEQYKKEYSDWVWYNGNHPSIVIWDAMNEQKQDYIGNVLIPELKKLDPTRIWDAGWMGGEEMKAKEMEEVHWYPLGLGWWFTDSKVKEKREQFRFGSLFIKDDGLAKARDLTYPMIVNEYGWLWLNRDGIHSAIRTEAGFLPRDITPKIKNYEYFEPDGTQLYSGRDVYDYFVGKNASAEENWNFQAYLHAIETETLRSARIYSGIFSFTYLTDNGGNTGDWFINNIKNLEPAPALLSQFHTLRPFAVFIDMEDGRYLKNPKIYEPGTTIPINLFGINDSNQKQEGTIDFEIINANGETIFTKKINISIEPFWQKLVPILVEIPKTSGGYMAITKLTTENNLPAQVSRRYFKVGIINEDDFKFPEFKYKTPPGWPLVIDVKNLKTIQ